FSGSAGYSIRYWFWYNFNDFPQGPDVEGSHPGDWEYVQLFFYNNNTLYQVNFSNHTGARKKGPGQVYMTDNHVHVWVGNGSHANYESQNPPDIYCWGPWCDEVNGFGPVWTCINLVNVYKTTFGRDNYCGDWGDGDGVFGPPCRKFSD
ncbi:MAG: hypothetical protein WCK34_14300, partial [Bacteroidota bacterium]